MAVQHKVLWYNSIRSMPAELDRVPAIEVLATENDQNVGVYVLCRADAGAWDVFHRYFPRRMPKEFPA